LNNICVLRTVNKDNFKNGSKWADIVAQVVASMRALVQIPILPKKKKREQIIKAAISVILKLNA
jgi:hypothetical protein